MADAIETDLIVNAIAEGFDKLEGNFGKIGGAAQKAEQKVSAWGRASKMAGKAVNEAKEIMGGATIALRVVTQAFSFASDEAEKLGRVDVATNIDAAQESLGGMLDVLVQIPIGGRDFLQWMGDGAAGLSNLAKTVGAVGIQFQLSMGWIDQETAIQQVNALVTDEAAEKAADLTHEKEKLTQATKEHEQAEKRIQDVLAATKGYKASQKAAEEAQQSITDLRIELRKLQIENGKAAFSDRELAEMKLDLEDATVGELEAARRLWNAQQDIVTAQEAGKHVTEEMTWAVENARISWERSKFQLEDTRVAYENARVAIIDNSNAINELNDRITNETDRWRDAMHAAEEYAAALDRVRERRDTSFEVEGGRRFSSTGGIIRRQHGGAFAAGGAVMINESPATRPEVVVANRSGGGQVLTRQQAQAALAGRASNSVSIGNVAINNGMDLAAFKAMLKRALI